ncbi:phosphoribosylanthranilate isomerase [Hymenobacter guriensis]|uniref:phosphoribosylanthranilate isomerase n=1 Tax=Hymenobacter guriensis TaxID=2793065 RepID=A0ABS0L3L8_9BACT|nr:hypothetical protein [Hymenobacter guriensis]MBG8554716.1 hypothetical protein [Hymenobacter guriensis]
MSLITSVLVRGINNLSDARYCAGMGADYLTFRLDPALPGFLEPAVVQELSGWVAGVQLVGEFHSLPIDDINALVAQCGLHYVLLHRARPAHELARLACPALQLAHWIPDMLPEDVDLRFRQLVANTEGIVLPDVPPAPLTGVQLAHLSEQARSYPVWLAAGFAEGITLRQLLQQVQVAGIVLEGGHEIKPGLRDFDEMEKVFEALED